ncbi:MAG: PAS domain-containing sensor histidine kinase [Thermodesulfobacteriota bacterium]
MPVNNNHKNKQFTGADISEHENTQNTLFYDQNVSRSILSATGMCIKMLDTKGNLLFMNDAGQHLMGIDDIQKLIGQSWIDFWHIKDRVKVRDAVQKAAKGEIGSFLAKHCFEVSEPKWWSVTISPVWEDDGSINRLIAISRDTTERKQIEDKLRNANKIIKNLFDNLPLVLIALDAHGEISLWNSMAEILFNVRSSDVLGKKFDQVSQQLKWTELMQSVHKNFQGTAFDNIHKEMRYTRNDGSTGFMDLRVLNLLDMPDVSEQMILIVGIDITEFKIMQGQLGQAQKLEAIGQLAAGIAHEINTPSQYVSDNLHFLGDAVQSIQNVISHMRDIYAEVKPCLPTERVQETEKLFEQTDLDFFMDEIPLALKQSSEGMERISKIVLSMKQFAHPGDEEKTYLDLNAIIKNAVTVTRNAWKYDAEMKLDLQENVPEIKALRGGINQVLLNIIVNAADAIKDKGREGDERGVIKISTRLVSEMVNLVVSDTGTGMPEEVRERIFEPFYTTKEVGKGTGQGLSIVHSIVVDQHGGNIRVDSIPGEGSTISISLPVS